MHFYRTTRTLLVVCSVFVLLAATSLSRAQELAPSMDPATDPYLIMDQGDQSPDTTVSPTMRRDWNQRIPALTRAGQRIASYLANLRSAIERSKGISSIESQTIRDMLNKDIAFVQTEIATAGKTQTESDLNQRVSRLKEFWTQKQNTVTYYLGLIAGNKYERTLERFRSIEAKFNTLFSRFEATPELVALKDQFSQELRAAEQNIAKAKDIFKAIQQPGDHREEFKEGLEAFKQAHAHLKEARRISRELISQLRSVLGVANVEPTSTPTIQP